MLSHYSPSSDLYFRSLVAVDTVGDRVAQKDTNKPEFVRGFFFFF